MIDPLFALLLTATQAAQLPVLVLPSDERAWVILIETRGGFTGRGTGSVSASSAGEVLCTSPGVCPTRLVPDTQQSIGRLVAALPVPADARSRPAVRPSICSDCVTTTMTVQRRDGDGARTIRFRWDESTLGTIPGDVLQLHAAVVALARLR